MRKGLFDAFAFLLVSVVMAFVLYQTLLHPSASIPWGGQGLVLCCLG